MGIKYLFNFKGSFTFIWCRIFQIVYSLNWLFYSAFKACLFVVVLMLVQILPQLLFFTSCLRPIFIMILSQNQGCPQDLVTSLNKIFWVLVMVPLAPLSHPVLACLIMYQFSWLCISVVNFFDANFVQRSCFCLERPGLPRLAETVRESARSSSASAAYYVV